MGQIYKILSATEGRHYPNKHKPGEDLVVWQVTLENAQPENGAAAFELHKRPGNTPQPGDTIEVKNFSPGDHDGSPYVRIFVESQQGSSGGGGNSGGGGGQRSDHVVGLKWASAAFERGAEHPRNEARMIHTSALSAAPAFIEQMLTVGVAEQPKNRDEYWVLVGEVAAVLRRSYRKVLSATESAPAAQAQSNGGEVPADTTDLPPGAPVPAGGAVASDEDIPF